MFAALRLPLAPSRFRQWPGCHSPPLVSVSSPLLAGCNTRPCLLQWPPPATEASASELKKAESALARLQNQELKTNSTDQLLQRIWVSLNAQKTHGGRVTAADLTRAWRDAKSRITSTSEVSTTFYLQEMSNFQLTEDGQLPENIREYIVGPEVLAKYDTVGANVDLRGKLVLSKRCPLGLLHDPVQEIAFRTKAGV